MKVRSTITRLDIPPGDHAQIPLEVINTSAVIDSISVRVVGIDSGLIATDPASLPLFPDALGEITVTITLPQAFPAGTYPIMLVVGGVAPEAGNAHHDLELVVPRRAAAHLEATPSLVRARRKASFRVTVHNDGNVPLQTALRAEDADRKVRTSVLPSTVAVPVGGQVSATVVVRGPRQLVGADRDRPITLAAHAVDADADIVLTLRQRSTVSRGLITVLVLLGIIAIWALAFLIGIRQVLGVDPYAKTAPASFFAATGAGAAGEDGAVDGAGATPDGALPKEGAIAAGTGASVTGKVTGQWDGEGVGRMSIDVLRETRGGLKLVSSTATLNDGTYTVAGLFPGSYLVRARASGYDTVWYPTAKSATAATTITAVAQQATDKVDLSVVGAPAQLTGTVRTTDAASDVPITVKATPTWPGAKKSQTKTVVAQEDGTYAFTGLSAPASYQLTFTAEGFEPTTRTERVLGGQDRYALDVTLGAGEGSISGTVTDGKTPVGAVTVTTSVDGKEVSVSTPTIGQVGAFTLTNLPTPATYVVTFTKEGFTTSTSVVDLSAGEVRTDLQVQLAGGAGTVTGRVVTASGTGLGDVSVTASGGSAASSTTTLTGSSAGSFTMTGLAVPGQYTLTFAVDGYTPASVPVVLSLAAPSGSVDVTLRSAVGSVHGRILSGGTGVAGVSVQLTDGDAVRTTISTATGDFARGSYEIDGLSSGTYTLSALDDSGRTVATAVVTVTAGRALRQDLSLPEAG